MIDDRQDLSYEQFVGLLRSALHYLYDPVHLRRSPLVDLLGLAGEFDRAAALQRTLVAAIRDLKPPDDESPQSRTWRIYDTLSLHYVRQLGRDAVANQLGISERQMRREQRLAIEALAQHLWHSHQLESTAGKSHSLRGAGTDFDQELPAGATLGGEQPDGRAAPPELRIPLAEALENVRGLALPLAQQMDVGLDIYLTASLVALPVSPMALRTILLTVLTVVIPRARSGAIAMTAARREDEIAIAVTCSDSHGQQGRLTDKDLAHLETAQEQAAFYDARLEIGDPGQGGLSATLLLPAPEQSIVFVVDDNADWLELVQRYAAGSRYQVVTSLAPETACAAAGKLQPSLIILDVMMHNIDGWQVLSELRHDPATSHIPVVVCTVLPLEEMALALGANAFLQKPVSQQQFLHVIERQGVL
ncbi:MAG: response regulator [Caldilineaceae bacterium]